MNSNRQLIVNADDFGFTPGVNRGIVEAHRCGILTATTLMANGKAFDDAVALARENPRLDVGCHLVLVQGESVLTPGCSLPASLPEMLGWVARGKLPIHEELSAQVQKILASGIRPTHLDTHKHTHLLPPVLGAVARLSEECGIGWVRRPFDFPLEGRPGGIPLPKRLVGRGLGLLRRQFHRTLSRHGCKTTDHFAGFQITGRFRTQELVSLIRELPEGLTEFMCHPGYCDDQLRSAVTRLTDSREDELAALMAPETRRALEEAGVELVSFGEIPGRENRN